MDRTTAGGVLMSITLVLNRSTRVLTALIVGSFAITLSGCQRSMHERPMTCSISDATNLPADNTKAALVNVELGLGYLQQGQIERAKTKLVHALELAPKISETHSAMAFFLEHAGEIFDAQTHHKDALRYAKTKGAVYNNYAAFLCRQQRFQEADEAFQQSLSDKKYAKTAEVCENAGVCALKAQETQKAKAYFLKALQQDPTRTTALSKLKDLEKKDTEIRVTGMMKGQIGETRNPRTASQSEREDMNERHRDLKQ